MRPDDPRRQPRLQPEQRFRMRRLTPDEMTVLCRLARQGRTGPGKALDALWRLILTEAEQAGFKDPESETWCVQDFAMPEDQGAALLRAMVERRRLPRKEVGLFHRLWAMYSPADYDDG